MILTKNPVDLLRLCEDTVKGFAGRLRERGLTCSVSGKVSEVHADAGKIMQAVSNIISNAINYSCENGTIRISVEDTDTDSVIIIEDNGIGISPDDLGHIFERFYRADRSRARRTGGAGIGLTIARAIIQAHGGNITAESREGEGSKFTLSLPKQ